MHVNAHDWGCGVEFHNTIVQSLTKRTLNMVLVS